MADEWTNYDVTKTTPPPDEETQPCAQCGRKTSLAQSLCVFCRPPYTPLEVKKDKAA